jgi:hypothetical protein
MDGVIMRIILSLGPKFRILAVFPFFFLLAACNVFFEKEPTDEDVVLFFQKNRKSLVEIVNLCEANESIQWIGKKPGQIEYYKNESEDLNLTKAVDHIRKTLNDLELLSLACTRDKRLEPSPLVSVIFPIYGRGLIVSGKSKGIKFLTSYAVVDSEDKSLSDQGWYLYTLDY